MAKRDRAQGHQSGTTATIDKASDEERAEKPAAEPKVKRQYFCESTGQQIDHKARFAGMGYDAQLKSRLVNAALVGAEGTRYDNATGEAITGPAEQLLRDLGWHQFLVKAQESRSAKEQKKAAKAAAKMSAEADSESEDEDEEEEAE